MSNANCSADVVSCWVASQVDILTNIANSLLPVQRLLSAGAYFVGILFIMKAIYSLKVYGESRTMMSSSSNIKEPMLYFLVGSMLLFMPTGVSVLVSSSFGYDSILAYAPVTSGSSTINMLFGADSAMGRPLSVLIRTIGVFAFIRGWILVARAGGQGQQPGGLGKGMIHVFGGILAMNIVGTLEMINNTLYGN